jgi:hypothetical protein
LLEVCYVPATSTGLSRLLFLRWPLTVISEQGRQYMLLSTLYNVGVYDVNKAE